MMPSCRPNRSAHPLPLLDDVRVCFLDELAHSAEGFSAPVPEFGDSFRDELRCRLALARARLFHVLILAARLLKRRVEPRGFETDQSMVTRSSVRTVPGPVITAYTPAHGNCPRVPTCILLWRTSVRR